MFTAVVANQRAVDVYSVQYGKILSSFAESAISIMAVEDDTI
jgi:hypothetical protein